MIRYAVLSLCLAALALGASSCRLPCGEPFWKKAKSLACEEEKPVLSRALY
jgi:hypothetical protein